ncbi:MAG: glycosyl transferase [Gammaproteobacteria bacterium]|nr:MAG: glycosyl transferase [Gammaproteobacteria bacterium]
MRKLINRMRGRNDTDATIAATESSSAPGAEQTNADNTPAIKRSPVIPGTDKIPFAPIPVKRYADELPLLALPARSADGPRISVVMVVYKMARQALNTALSLVPPYQRGLDNEDVELIVVENRSDANMDESALTAISPCISYYLRDETEPTPVHAANFGIEKARGELVVLLIDGARMVTPGLLNQMLGASQLAIQPVIATPSYHLGEKVQQQAMLEGYDEEAEQVLLASINWPQQGYKLYDISCLSRTSMGGIFRPFSESNCLAAPKKLLEELGGFDRRFNETGGGQANLDLYKRLVEHEHSQFLVLPGEGSFHQFHGGVTTGQQGEKRHQAMVDHFAQYAAIRGGAYVAPNKRPIYVGAVPDNAVRFIRNSGNALIKALQEEQAEQS